MAGPFLQIEHLSKRFGEKLAADDISLSVEQGEFFALLGPSGCGKTTLLRMLAGFEQPTAGRILIDGADVTEMPPYERPVNMMFQSYALFPHMTVAQNVAFGLRQDGLDKAVIRDRVREILDLVQIGGHADRKPSKLSGGEKQRVALARALVKHPKLLLLDEPLGALDRKLREQTQFELVRIQRRIGITFVVVTHDQDEAMSMASRIAVMEGGKLRQVGTPGQIYETPNSRFVADFIGAVNLFTGAVIMSESGSVTVESPELRGAVTVADQDSCSPGDAVAVALRPEKVALSREEPRDQANRVRGTVRDIAYLGEISIYGVELPSGATMRVSLLNAERHVGPRFEREEAVWLSWSAEAGVLLRQ